MHKGIESNTTAYCHTTDCHSNVFGRVAPGLEISQEVLVDTYAMWSVLIV